MSIIERYRSWYEQEKCANGAILAMLESVPADRRRDAEFLQAVRLAAHLAACRENWLDRMVAKGTGQVEWWAENPEFDQLRARYEALEAAWTHYLASLDDRALILDFDFPTTDGGTYCWNVEGQIQQLVGHAFYHRGQIALLVDQLGGETVDTDYLYWAFEQNPERWKRLG